MNILITEEQHKSTQTKLKNMIKKLGWEPTAKAVGGSKNLVKLGFNNDPMEFLSIYNDLNVVQSEKYLDLTLFKDKNGDNLMLYNSKTEYVYMDYDRIWQVLQSGFGFGHSEMQDITQKWLAEVYNLYGITTISFYGQQTSWLG